MKIKRSNSILVYKEYDDKITEYELLTRFSPYFISNKIKKYQAQIECMYDLNMSHSTETVHGFTTVSVKLEDLVIYIVEEREKLESYRKRSVKNVQILKRVMEGYNHHQQKEIMKYFATHGEYYPSVILYQLRKDIYKIVHKQRLEREENRSNMIILNRYKHAQQIKQALHTQREVLTV